MFTGIIKEIGVVKKVLRKGVARELTLSAVLAEGLNPGDSISINGVCLTVTSKKGKEFNLDAVPETIQKTTLGNLKLGDKVNLEPPLAAGQPLGGHLLDLNQDAELPDDHSQQVEGVTGLGVLVQQLVQHA